MLTWNFDNALCACVGGTMLRISRWQFPGKRPPLPMDAKLFKVGSSQPSRTAASANSCTSGALKTPQDHLEIKREYRLCEELGSERCSCSASCQRMRCRTPPGTALRRLDAGGSAMSEKRASDRKLEDKPGAANRNAPLRKRAKGLRGSAARCMMRCMAWLACT